jgi:hypothetical protein
MESTFKAHSRRYKSSDITQEDLNKLPNTESHSFDSPNPNILFGTLVNIHHAILAATAVKFDYKLNTINIDFAPTSNTTCKYALMYAFTDVHSVVYIHKVKGENKTHVYIQARNAPKVFNKNDKKECKDCRSRGNVPCKVSLIPTNEADADDAFELLSNIYFYLHFYCLNWPMRAKTSTYCPLSLNTTNLEVIL